MKVLQLTVLSALLLLNVSIVLSSECESTSPHNYHFGARENGDSLLYTTMVRIREIWFMVRDQDVSWPLPGELSDANITEVVVTDRLGDDDGGCATITEGGPGYSNVSLHITTQRSGAANFIIDVYGTGY